MKKVIILILSMLIPSYFLKANPAGQEAPINLEEIFRLSADEVLFQAISKVGKYIKEKSSKDLEWSKKMYALLENLRSGSLNSITCFFGDDLKEPLHKASALYVAFLEELSLLPEITKDSINLHLDKTTTAMMQAIAPTLYSPERSAFISKELWTAIGTCVGYHATVCFLMKQIEALPVPSCSDENETFIPWRIYFRKK